MSDSTLYDAYDNPEEIAAIAGDTLSLAINVVDEDCNAIDLTGATITWVLAQTSYGPVLLTKAIDAGITVPNAIGGQMLVRLDPPDTVDLPPGVYYHSTQIIDAAGDVSTVLSGTLTLTATLIPNADTSVTWPPAPPGPGWGGLTADGITPTQLAYRAAEFTTVAPGGQAMLPRVATENVVSVSVFNRGLNPLGVLPPPGGAIEDAAADAPFMVPVGDEVAFFCFDPITAPGMHWLIGGAASEQGFPGVASFNARTGDVTLTQDDVSGAGGLLTTGGAMTGPLTLVPPVNPTDAASKAYVDALQAQITTLQDQVATLAARHQVASSTTISSNPVGTSSSTLVMMGLGITFTPSDGETRAVVLLDAQITNSSNNGTSNAQLYYGSGTPPANGDAATGTAIGGPIAFIATSGGGAYTPFSQSGLLPGLTPNTTYWIDLAMSSSGTSVASVQSVDVTIFSLSDPVVF